MTPRLEHTVMSCLQFFIQSRSHFRSHGPLQDPQWYFGGSSFDITVCHLKSCRFRQVYSMQHIQDLLTREKVRRKLIINLLYKHMQWWHHDQCHYDSSTALANCPTVLSGLVVKPPESVLRRSINCLHYVRNRNTLLKGNRFWSQMPLLRVMSTLPEFVLLLQPGQDWG